MLRTCSSSRAVVRCVLLLLVPYALGCHPEPRPEILSASTSSMVLHRGASLVNGVAACGACHGAEPQASSPLQGGMELKIAGNTVRGANITPDVESGLGRWSTSDIVRAVRDARSRSGRQLASRVHQGYEWMSDDDALAIASYLRTLEPVSHSVPAYTPGFFRRNFKLLFGSAPAGVGFVPVIQQRFTAEYGAYLTDHVARCGRCHNGPEGVFSSGGYLVGGVTVITPAGSKIAPDITSNRDRGIGSWSVEELVKYLRAAGRPDGSVADPALCPTNFYKNSEPGDLEAIAVWLKNSPRS